MAGIEAPQDSQPRSGLAAAANLPFCRFGPGLLDTGYHSP